MGKFLFNPTTGDRNVKNSLQPSRDNVFLGIALGATEPHRIEKLIPPVITNTREWLLYMVGTDPETLKGFYDKNGDGRGDEQGDKEWVLSWRANRRSELAGLQVTVTGAKEGLELVVDPKSGTNADTYINALSNNGISLTNPVVLGICVYENGEPYMSENLSMSIIYENGVYDTFYRIDGDPSTGSPQIETLVSDDGDANKVCVDNPVYPAVYVIDRRSQAI